jgi:hypothetical protein
MADTFTAASQAAVAWAASATMIGLLNNSANVVRVYRIWVYNNSVGTVSGGTCIYQLWRGTGTTWTGGTALTPIRHNPAGVIALTSIGVNTLPTSGFTNTALLSQHTISNDEIAVTSLTMEELQAFKATGLIWDAGYGDSNVEPLVIRNGQGIRLLALAAGAGVGQGGTYAGSAMFAMEFTVAAS